jgi:ribonuclease R
MAKRKPKISNKPGRVTKRKLERAIVDLFAHSPQKQLNYKQVSASVGATNAHDRELVVKVLAELKAKETLKEPSRGKYQLGKPMAFVQGRVDLTQSGSAYVITDQIKEDIYIPPKFVGHALQGDLVNVFLLARKKRKGPEGQITEVVERAKTDFVGTVEVNRNFAFLVPDSRKMPVDLYIPLDKLNGAKHGEKAIGRLTDWPKEASSPFGEITEVLGKPFENETEMAAILADKGLPLRFPEGVEDTAAKISMEITDEEVARREDFREVTTFTIDPLDAKDFDDALSVRNLDNGNIEVGVHIADVTHYVREGDSIDVEAVNRATSVYLVDRVIPMLPEVLSNGVCSLRPNEDKLTYAVLFEMNEEAQIIGHRIKRTVIHSDRRFTYEEAQERLETGTGDYAEELNTLNSLAKKLRAKRMSSGAIAFDKVEVRFLLDDNKNPSSVYFKVQKDAHKLIEEFMLLANRTVATVIGKPGKEKKPKTFVYRIHDKPDPEKLMNFSLFIKTFGYNYNFSNPDKVSKGLNKLLEEIQGKREEGMLETLAIRTMAKAEYSTENIGHYGLAFDYYSHFTSPIRRYPDVMVHRLLHKYLEEGENSANANKYEALCKHSSEMERKAAEAERESVKYYQVLYMKDHVGEEFDGVISGVTEWGIYVELTESKCEGMVRLRDIEGDYYFFDEANHRIMGHNYNNTYTLGDDIRIRITKADLYNKRLDFVVVDEED